MVLTCPDSNKFDLVYDVFAGKSKKVVCITDDAYNGIKDSTSVEE